MKKVIIFGLEDFAELAHYYLTNDTEHEVVAFTVNQRYLPETKTFKGLPIVAFDDIEQHFKPEEYSMFAPMSPAQMNKIRENIYLECKRKGYEFISYISTKATVLTKDIGDNCFILEDNTIQPFVKIGNNVIMWSGNHIGHHSTIEDNVMFTSHVVLSGHCTVKKYSVLGVNSTVRDGVVISEGTFVGMAASITKDTDAWMIYVGSPAKPLKPSL